MDRHPRAHDLAGISPAGRDWNGPFSEEQRFETPPKRRQKPGVRDGSESGRQTDITGDREPEKRSLAQLSDQTTTLARKEVELAQAEMSLKARRLGFGAGAVGAVGLIGVLALGGLTAAAILALAEAVDTWVAALIVALVYAAVGGVLSLIGRGRV